MRAVELGTQGNHLDIGATFAWTGKAWSLPTSALSLEVGIAAGFSHRFDGLMLSTPGPPKKSTLGPP